MKIDNDKLLKAALRLKKVFTEHAADSTVSGIYASLAPLIEDSINGDIVNALDWENIPCGYFFIENNDDKYSELESAYANWKIEITGGETSALRKLKEDMSKP